jgi:hypothetical protein
VWSMKVEAAGKYVVCPESKGTKVLTMYNFFNLQKRHCEWIAFT